jgi:VanZ family protein
VRLAFRTWVPAVGWTLMTVAAAGELLSASHTSAWLRSVVLFLLRRVSTGEEIAVADAILRKSGHFLNYAILSWLWFRAARYWELREKSREWALRWSRWGFLLAALTALADEWLQHFVSSRTSNPADVALDCAGALFAQLLILRVWLARRKRAAARTA